MVSGYAFREAEVEDWEGIAALLGRPAEAARDLRRWVQREYDSWFSWVAVPETHSDSAVLAGAVIAGLPRAQAVQDAEDQREREGRIVWLGVAAAHRRRGLGGHLLILTLDEFRRRQATRAAALVDGTQVEALGLFRKQGFHTESQSLGLLLPVTAAATLAARTPRPEEAPIRRMQLNDVALMSGLLIQLGLERAQEPHDDLEALTPAQVERWLQGTETVAYAAWEREDPRTPVGLAWATRRSDDGLLRYVGVREDDRRQGVGSALLAAVAEGLARPLRAPNGEGEPSSGRYRALRTHLHDPGEEQQFFRRLGFEAEHVTLRLVRDLS